MCRRSSNVLPVRPRASGDPGAADSVFVALGPRFRGGKRASTSAEQIRGKIPASLEYERNDRHYEPVEERVKHWREFVLPLPEEETRTQAARCMDCGIPYCHTGCPVHHQIPDWNA